MDNKALTTTRITIKDIARLAGVSKTAVSGIINNRPRVGKQKHDRVLEIMRQYNYVPQMSARTLATNRTYQIGFLVSSSVTLGLSNAYFSAIESGVSEACKKHNYQMLVSTYDLSDINTFVMPQKLKQRSIDALIVVGNSQLEVLKKLESQNIPFVSIGGDYSDDILSLKTDMQATYVNTIKYMMELGHYSFCYASSAANSLIFKDAISKSSKIASKKLKFKYELLHGENAYDDGAKLASSWLKMPQRKRFTTFLSNDQACCGFLAALHRNAIKCPDEISIISCCDTVLCEWNAIPITAISFPLAEYGFLVTELLIDVLEGRKQLDQIKKSLKKEYKPHDFIVRQTTGLAPQMLTNNPNGELMRKK